MNESPANLPDVFDASDPLTAKSGFNVHLSFYHANGKNTGSAIRFSVEPATADRDGAVFFSLAKQKSVGNAASAGADRFASFDWANKITVKLNFIEVVETLMVFSGQEASLTHAGKDGFFHNSPSATTSVSLKRAEDPGRPGFLLGVGRTPKADPNARQYMTFAFRPAEALGLRFALQSQLGVIAFGIPHGRQVVPEGGRFTPIPLQSPTAAGAFAPPPSSSIQSFHHVAAAPEADDFGNAF